MVRRHLGGRVASRPPARRWRQDRATRRRRSSRPRAPAGCTPGRGASRRPARTQDNAWKFISWASSKDYEDLVGTQLGWATRPGRQADLDLRQPRLPEGGRRLRRGDRSRRSAPPTRRTRVSSRGRRSASSSSTSRSSPTSAPRSRRTSARRSPGKSTVDAALDKGQQDWPRQVAARSTRASSRRRRAPHARAASPHPRRSRRHRSSERRRHMTVQLTCTRTAAA